MKIQNVAHTQLKRSLKNAGYTTVEQIANLTYEDLIKIHGIGDTAIQHISDLRVANGYTPITFPTKKGIVWTQDHKENHKAGVKRGNERRKAYRK